MTRRIAPSASAPVTPGAPVMTAQPVAPSMPGGAVGVLPGASSKIHFPGVPSSFAAAGPAPEGEIPKVARYVVFDCPKPPGAPAGFRVNLNGVLSYMQDGKQVDGNSYDIAGLERQGVKLKHLGDF